MRAFPPDRKRIDIGDYYADDRLIRQTLGWEPRVSLATVWRARWPSIGNIWRITCDASQPGNASMSVIIPQTDPRANYLRTPSGDRCRHRRRPERRTLYPGRAGDRASSASSRPIWAWAMPIGVGSGTDALHLALRACGIGPGHPVFTVSHTAVATVAAIELCGATPVLVDIDPADFTMDPQRLEEQSRQAGRAYAPANKSRQIRIDARPGSHRTLAVPRPYGYTFRGAIIPVHLYGQPADTARSWRSRAATAWRYRRLRAGARRDRQRPDDRRLRRHRRVQLLSDQESGRAGRRRRGGHERRQAGGTRAACCGSTAGGSATSATSPA